MPLEIVTVPCLSDNYAYILHEPQAGVTALVDAPEATPILEALDARGWSLDLVLITHHHSDHVMGLADILAKHTAKVAGNAQDATRLPALDHPLEPGDKIAIGAEDAHVLDVSGHTVGHIAFHLPGAGAVFTADSLMVMGCGRVFEGTHEQMWDSLQRLAALPDDTFVYSGHEYATANMAFALSITPDDAALKARSDRIEKARAANLPTVPATLAEEKQTNPYLRAEDPLIAQALNMTDASSFQVFSELRSRKDRF